MGVLEDNCPCSDNDWESVKGGGDAAIKTWIAGQLQGRTCTVVLVGQNTAGRKWITHEIIESWKAGMGVVGIHIHNLKNVEGNQCPKGGDPFASLTLGDKKLSSIVKLYDPIYSTSTNVYNYIHENIGAWVEEAIQIRAKY
jgi:hypothetical protein